MRFWWPTVSHDVNQMVLGCGHCWLVNNASHDSQMELQALETDVPFDIMFLDVWEPGRVPEEDGSQKVLMFIDCMMGFAVVMMLSDNLSAENMAWQAFTSFFVPYGLPQMIVVDAARLFAMLFQQLFAWLLIPVHMVAPENHKAIWNEHFHWYLNKVEQINMADKGSFQQWWQGVMFSLYAWNVAPIDGTDICHSFVVIG